MKPKAFADRLFDVKKITGISQHDFELAEEIAPQARGWADEIVQFFQNVDTSKDKKSASEQILKDCYLSFFDTVNNEDVFWQEMVNACWIFRQDKIVNEFLIGFSALLITEYGRKDGMRFTAAFERIIKTGMFLQHEEMLD